jgi:hypothetical protein
MIREFMTAIALMMEAVSTSETSFSSYQTTRRNIPEDSHLQCISCRRFFLLFISASCHYQMTRGTTTQGSHRTVTAIKGTTFTVHTLCCNGAVSQIVSPSPLRSSIISRHIPGQRRKSSFGKWGAPHYQVGYCYGQNKRNLIRRKHRSEVCLVF